MTHRPAPSAEARPESPAQRSKRVRDTPQSATGTGDQPGAAQRLTGTATAITLALIAVAVTVHLSAAATTRRLLSFAFAAHPPGPGAARGILTGNLRLAAAPLAGALLLQLADRDGRTFIRRRAVLDAIITMILGLNVVTVGAGFGAYGAKMVRYALPHAPVELAGYCCALTVYATARDGRPQARQAWLLASASVALLAVAAVLEAVASPI